MKVPGLSVHQSDKLPREITVEKAQVKPVRVDSGVKTAQAETPKGSAVQGQLVALLKTLGLPADKLSHSIISFAKFFSLPLEPQMLANVRKASLTAQQPDSLPIRHIYLPDRQALAALAAADKGVSLSPAALRDYAAAIDPDQQGDHAPDGQPDGLPNGQAGLSDRQASGGEDADERGNASPDRRDGRQAGPALLLKEQFCESAGSSPALYALNRLPGRNGRRWLVFPLSFTENGDLFRVSLRILLDGDSGTSYAVRRMSLDIAQRDCGLSGAEQRWLFILDREKPDSEGAGGSRGQSRLTVLLRPSRPHGALKSLRKKLSRCMDLPIESITVRNYRDSDFAADSRDDVLPIINKEV